MGDFTATRVLIPGSRDYATLRYVGPIEGKNGTFCGLELSGTVATMRGKNSGSVDGVQYFDVVVPGSGLFVPFDRLKSCNPHLEAGNETPQTPTMSGMAKFRQSASRVSSPFSPPRYELLKVRTQNGSSRPASGVGSRKSSGSLYQKSPFGGESEISILKRQIADIKSAHERDTLEKTAILEELQRTVADAQPILDDYEFEILERDSKIARQKADFDAKREEWRKSMDLLVSTQQENEIYFEKEIKSLHAEIQKLRSEKRGAVFIDESSEYLVQIKVDEMQQRLNAQEQEHRALVATKDREIRMLKQKAIVLSADDVTKTEISTLTSENKRLLHEVIELKEAIAEKEAEILEMTEKQLAKEMSSVTLESQSEQELKEKVLTLEHELEIRPSVDELMKLQDAMDEISHQHQKALQAKSEQVDATNKKNQELEAQLNAALALLLQQSQQLASPLRRESSSGFFFNSTTNGNGSNGSNNNNTTTNNTSPSRGLPVYKLLAPVDPGAGKDLWCALCERDGHSSIACPYDQDIY